MSAVVVDMCPRPDVQVMDDEEWGFGQMASGQLRVKGRQLPHLDKAGGGQVGWQQGRLLGKR